MHTEEERVEDLKDVCYAGGEDGCGGVAATKLLKTALSFFKCIYHLYFVEIKFKPEKTNYFDF